MEHKLTGPQPKPINIEKGVFESCGVFYFINTEAMAFDRIKRFAELLPVIVYGRKYHDLAMFIHDLRIRMTSGGDDFKKTFFDVATSLTNWDQYLLDNTMDGPSSHIDDILRFCALFCVTKDEDMTKLNDVLIEEKITNWKKDMDMMSFFLLSRLQVPRYRELLEVLSMEAKTNGGRLIPAPKVDPPKTSDQQD